MRITLPPTASFGSVPAIPRVGVRVALTWLLLGFAQGCSDTTPVEPSAPELQLGVVAGESGCYVVEIESHALGVFPSFSGVVSGDLTGTSEVVFDFTETRFDGGTIKNSGILTWHIDGGIVPELVGTTFRTITSPMNISTAGGSSIVGRARALDDFPATANLTFDGVFNADGSGPPFPVDLVYRGVICP